MLPPLPSLTELEVESLSCCPAVLPRVCRLMLRSNPFIGRQSDVAAFFQRFPELRVLDVYGRT